MKCWITWENYRYFRLVGAFIELLAFARTPADYHVYVNGKPVNADGGALVWGAATPEGRSAAAAHGLADVLTAEDMVDDLHVWQPEAWRDFIAQRRQWANELFDYLR